MGINALRAENARKDEALEQRMQKMHVWKKELTDLRNAPKQIETIIPEYTF